MTEREWTIKSPAKQGEERSEQHQLTIRWRTGEPHEGLEFQSSEWMGVGDTGVLYSAEEAASGAIVPEEDFAKADRFVDGLVKWDGCSHVEFGDERGYLHLCGGFAFARMLWALRRVTELAVEHAQIDDCADFPIPTPEPPHDPARVRGTP